MRKRKILEELAGMGMEDVIDGIYCVRDDLRDDARSADLECVRAFRIKRTKWWMTEGRFPFVRWRACYRLLRNWANTEGFDEMRRAAEGALRLGRTFNSYTFDEMSRMLAWLDSHAEDAVGGVSHSESSCFGNIPVYGYSFDEGEAEMLADKLSLSRRIRRLEREIAEKEARAETIDMKKERLSRMRAAMAGCGSAENSGRRVFEDRGNSVYSQAEI